MGYRLVAAGEGHLEPKRRLKGKHLARRAVGELFADERPVGLRTVRKLACAGQSPRLAESCSPPSCCCAR